MENFNSTRETASLLFNGVVLDPQQWSPQGVKCIYQNATYEAETTFSNNTQLSSTRVKEWNGAFSFSFNTTNIAVASLSLVESFISLVMGTAYMLPSNRNFVLKTDVTSDTVLFNITGNQTNSTNTFFSFSLNSMLEGNLSAGLQDLFGNVTLAFVNERMTTTFTDAAVTPNSTEYQYIGWRLALIYGIVFGFSLVVITYGLFCLQKNGTVATFDLKHILEMTARSTSLHESAARPEFDSTLVKGTLSPVSEGNRHRLVVLEVSD
ncbi:hypothetical protein D9757_008696 [Collybiopsis confluens]|uniref:Uncharacterized protein n=1 Tax=Collybiopsis confluens TaxID=2823264 RepID=A0A8H5H425_9AGAR|nr:hypothetical protein D9757_008696 [Collybiopsis confluens]